jgi:glycosyltransferase involved in cell wall biosynthesis
MERVLTVVTDGRALTARAGGVQRYTHALFGALAARADVRVIAAGVSPDGVVPPGVSRLPARWTLPTNLGWCATGLPWAARGLGDVFHAPAYTAPLWGARPLVLTIHDVSYARAPQWYPYRRDPVRLAFYRRCARRADWIVTDSAFSRAEIIAAYGVRADRVVVIPLGVETHFVPGSPVTGAPYLLHVGDLHPRRQVGLLLDLVLDLRRDERWRTLQLVLVGRDLGEGPRLRTRAAGHPGALVHHERVDEEVLVTLYQGARALLLASRYEGFGLPVLEAMACGVPVIVADAGSLPEVAGKAGVVVAVDDRRAWAEAVRSVLEQPERARWLADAGLRQAAAYSWHRVAQATRDVYLLALNARSNAGA